MANSSDDSSSFLHLQRDVESLNPAVVTALLNGSRPASNNVASPLLLQSGFFPFTACSPPSFPPSAANSELLAALSLGVCNPFVTDPLTAALSMVRAQQNVSSTLSSRAVVAGSRRGGCLFESIQGDAWTSVQNEAKVSEAYQRGREEAILSLLRSGPVGQSTCVEPVTSSITAPSVAVTTTNVVRGTVADLVSPKDSNTRALETLGTDARRKTNAPYFDASPLDDPDESTLSNRRTRGGVTEPFPEKLHRMLHETSEIGKNDIISFYPHGRAFGIHHPERFCREIMPKYFKQSRLSSFQRQLNLYGFTRISSGPDCGGYYHELFLKGRPALCIHMRRVGVAQGATPAKGNSRMTNTVIPTGATPDFYSMPPITEKEAPRNAK